MWMELLLIGEVVVCSEQGLSEARIRRRRRLGQRRR